MPGQAQLITRERQGTIWRHGGPSRIRRWALESPILSKTRKRDSAFGRKLLLLSRRHVCSVHAECTSPWRRRPYTCPHTPLGHTPFLRRPEVPHTAPRRSPIPGTTNACAEPALTRTLPRHRWATQPEILPTPASAWPSKPARDRKLLLVSYLQVTQLQNGGAPGQGRGVAAARLAQAGTCIGPTSRAFIVVAAVCATICPTRARPRGLAIVSDEPLLPDSRPCKYLRALARALV